MLHFIDVAKSLKVAQGRSNWHRWVWHL